MLTKALTTEELAGTTAGGRRKKGGGPEGRAEVAQEEGKARTRRIMRCGDWIRLGDAAESVMEKARDALEDG